MASGSFSYTHSTQRENDYRQKVLATGFYGYAYITATISYGWNSGFSNLSQTVQIRDSNNNAVASGSGSGLSGTFTISASLNPTSSYYFWGSASSFGGQIFAYAQGYGTVSWVTLNPPIISSFVTNNEEITEGQTSTLTWSIVGDASSASIDQGIGSVNTLAGSEVVSPTQTTTYTLSASNVAGSAPSKSVTVTVYPKPEIDSFTISSTDILQGNTLTAQWQTTGSTTVVLSGSSGAFLAGQFPPSNVDADGSYSWTAGEGGSYTIKLTAYNELEVKEEKILSFTVRDETPNDFEWEDKTEISLLERLNQESETITINGFGPTQYSLSELPIKSNYPIEVMVNGDGIWRNVEEI
jgi:hypothetical protein